MASLTSSPHLSSKPVVNREYNTFVKGIITEASPLIFPENASLDEQNFVLNNDGSRNRRFGIEYENEGSLITDSSFTEKSVEGWATSDFRWNNILGSPALSILVTQVGNTYYFFDFTEDNPTSHGLNQDNANPLTLVNADPTIKAQYTSIDGILVIIVDDTKIYRVRYEGGDVDAIVDDAGNALTIAESLSLQVRDIWGVEEDIDPDPTIDTILKDDKRPTFEPIQDHHEYNLMNQGWPRLVATTNLDTTAGLGDKDTIQLTFDTKGFYPSNGDVWFLGKQGAATFAGDVGTYNPFSLAKVVPGNFKAPRGGFIIDLFSRGNARQMAANEKGTNTISGLPADITTGGIRSVASFAGRLFYSLFETDLTEGDDSSPRFDGSLVFTRVVRNGSDLIQCHSDNDPTSEDFPDLLDSDGGYLTIPEASNIVKLVSTGRSLVVFASNGVWQLSGGNDNQFSAGNFFINKISNVGALGFGSIVEAEGLIFYWGEGGIYLLQPNQLGDLSVQNISEATIQTLYNAIPTAGKVFATGAYDPALKIVNWLYNDSDPSEYDGQSFRYKYNKELIFDVQLSAFYKNVIGEITDPAQGPYVSSSIISPNVASLDNTSTIIATLDLGNPLLNGDVTANSEVDQVVNTIPGLTSAVGQTRYLTWVPDTLYSFTYSLYRQINFIDWLSFDDVGVDSPAFLETGYEILQDTQRRKHSKYITMNFKRSERGFEIDSGTGNLVATNPTSCLVQARWDYADTANSGKFGIPFQAYRLNRNYIPSGTLDPFDYGHSVITTKSKLRGRGRSLYLRMDSEPASDLHIYGWAIEFTAGASV